MRCRVQLNEVFSQDIPLDKILNPSDNVWFITEFSIAKNILFCKGNVLKIIQDGCSLQIGSNKNQKRFINRAQIFVERKIQTNG